MSRGWAGGSTHAWRRLREQAIAYWPHVCGICGEAIDADLPHPHPRSMSVDHRIPKALGGPDELWNTQLTHASCNAGKGDKLHHTPAKATHSRPW